MNSGRPLKVRRFALTRSGDIYITLTLLTAALSVILNNNYLTILFCTMASYFIISSFMTLFALRRIRARRVLPDHVFADERMDYSVVFQTDRRWFPAFMLTFRDRIRQEDREVLTDPDPLIPMARPGKSYRVTLATPPLRRGMLSYQGIYVTSEFPPGFTRATTYVPLHDEMLVYPRRARIVASWARTSDHTLETLQELSSTTSHGYAEWAGLRDFHPGDNPRHIHWKSYGRVPDQLLVKEFESTRISHAMILLDTYIPRPDDHRRRLRLETAISCAGALAEYLAERNTQVSLLTVDGNSPSAISRLSIDRGRFPMHRLYEFLARLQPAEHHPMEELLSQPEVRGAHASIFLLPLSQRPVRNAGTAVPVPGQKVMIGKSPVTIIAPSEMRSWIRFAP